MSQAWLDQQERGSVLAMKLIVWLSLLLGRAAGRLLLHPACVYFMLFTPRARRASRDYLSRVFGRRATLRQIYRHYFYFAATLLDRMFLLAGRHQHFVINKYGLDTLRDVVAAGRGCLFLGAHLGSFELVRSGGASRWGLTINLMMYEANAQKIKRMVESIQGGVKLRVLPIGTVDSMIQAQQRIATGEMLAILGDRAVSGDRTVTVPFLGGQAAFPVGPVLAASTLRVPVVLFFGLYRGGNRYEEHFELFAERVALDRRARESEIKEWVARYARRLEHYCRLAPYNWFNFYDFWEPPET